MKLRPPTARNDGVPVDRDEVAEAGGAGNSLHDYLKNKLQFAELLQAILHQARQWEDNLVEAECQELLSRLASDRFNLVVVGQFNRGKSTLMNAILGMDRLPTGVLPLTSVITSVGYGDRECVLLHRNDGGLPIEVPLAELAQHVTEVGNPGNRNGIAIAEVQLPVELLRLGFHFVDTPGVGSVIAENTRTTKAFLPQADAAIFVTSFDSPLDERELTLLIEVLDHVREVFVVVNKSDTVSPEQKHVVINFVRSQLPERLAEKDPCLFPVSALQAMRSRMEGDASGLDESGLLELEKALVRFLRVEKSREFLLRVADRTEELLRKLEELSRLSEQTLYSPEQRAELAARQRRHAAGLQETLRHAMDQAKASSVVAIRKRLEPDIDSLPERLVGPLLAGARDWLAAASFEDLLGESDALASRVSEKCRDLTAGWLAEHHRIFAQEIEAGLQQAEPLVNRILREASRIAVEAPAALGTAVPNVPAPWTPHTGDDLAWFVPSLMEWKPGLLICLWKIPAPLVKRLILKRLCHKLRVSLLPYSDQTLELVDHAAEGLIDRQRDSLGDRIEAETSRILNGLEDESIGLHACAVADWRHRLATLRIEVEAIPLEEPETVRPESLDPLSSARVEPVPDAHAICVICKRLVTAIFEFMCTKQYSLSMDASDQRQYALASGFCLIHSWEYEGIASPQGMCLAYPPLLELIAARLRSLASSAASAHSLMDGVAEILPTSVKCPACQLAGSVEKATIREIVGGFADAARASVPPLCLIHLYAVLNARPGAEQSRNLVEAQANVFERIAEDMRTYALKHNAIRRRLVTNQEHRAHRTALLRLVGHRRSGKGGQ